MGEGGSMKSIIICILLRTFFFTFFVGYQASWFGFDFVILLYDFLYKILLYI